jgi:SPX domain protein involved in polyphosphate accumulation
LFSAGEEIKSLSRFIGAQRLAFTKLLKKYKKWTGSESLEWRFKSEVLSRPESFTKLDLGPHLDHWTDVLQDIRVATGTGRAAKSGNSSSAASPMIHPMPSRHVENSAAVSQRIQTVISSGSDVDFDSVLANMPLGHQGSRALYWVHPEQLVELQILLLQHTRLSIPKRSSMDASSSGSRSPALTHQSSVTTRDGWVERDGDTGVIVLDNVEEFAHVQSSTPLSDGEDSSGRLPSQPTATIRWSLEDDIAVSIRDGSTNTEWRETKIQAKLRRKHLGAFLNAENINTPWRVSETVASDDGQSAGMESQKVDRARSWLAGHGNVKALVAISSRRTRFVNLPNARASGQWCALDSDICMKKVSVGDLAGKEWPSTIRRDATRFLYPVLEVRQEGKNSSDIIKILDESHLVSAPCVQFAIY